MELSNNNGKYQSVAEYLNDNMDMVRKEDIAGVQYEVYCGTGLTIDKSYLRTIVMTLLVAHGLNNYYRINRI